MTPTALKAFFSFPEITLMPRGANFLFIFHLFPKDYFLLATLLAFENPWGVEFIFL